MFTTVTPEQFLHRLDITRPQWMTEYADQRDLEQFIHGRITEDTLRNRTAWRILPIAGAMWDCAVEVEAAYCDLDGGVRVPI